MTGAVAGSGLDAAERRWLEAFARGPSRTRWERLPPQAGDPAPDIEMLDSDGRALGLSELWAEGPAILLFWRHFGCSCGVERAARLREEHPRLAGSGATVALVGQAEPERTAAYGREHGLECVLLCDPGERAYRAYGLRDGSPAQVLYDAPEEYLTHPRELGASFQRQRAKEGRPPVDSPWLMPGEFVVDGSGVIQLAYHYQYCEDYPDPRLLAAALAAPTARARRRPAG